MRNTKKNECEKLHRELWYWLAETGNEHKYNWPGWKKYRLRVDNECFACEFTFKGFEQHCTKCPLDWCKPEQIKNENESDWDYEDFVQCQCVSSTLYVKWIEAEKLYLKKKYAKQIAEMPWNPK